MFILLVITSVCRSINSCYLSTFQIYLFVRSFIYWFFYFIYLHCNIVSCYFHCFYYEFSTSSLEFRLSKNHRWSRCERILKNITIKFLLSFFLKFFDILFRISADHMESDKIRNTKLAGKRFCLMYFVRPSCSDWTYSNSIITGIRFYHDLFS